MKLRNILMPAAALAALAAPSSLAAHRLWILPSTTVLSSEDGWVTFDAAASNDLFYPDHQPLRVEPAAIAPDGSAAKVENFATGRFRSTFDLHLTRQGTWKIVLANGGVGGSFVVGGKEQRLPRGTTADTLTSVIPAGATDVKLTEIDNRNEVFVTSGAPTETVFTATGKGLEFIPETHPNDLVAGETATFGFLVDGQPASGLTLTVIPGGSRYRDAVGEMTFTTDAAGKVEVTWPGPGMYWLNVTATGRSATLPNADRRLGYTTTLEVLGD